MILVKNPMICKNRVVKRNAIFGVMQSCHGNFFCFGGVLVAGISSEFPHIFR